ncbi:histidine kinase [uncultured Polaribacter sp.]|uniref:sensor histidine kinase n=1 Tax=uncultured Polaribacter sp. TaxID=174711 RepID=UPI002609A5BB|nr:histidine kinase [uncultured Polaribacter sp.]
MKKLIVYLVLFLSFLSFAQEEEKLPKEVWEEIVEINHNERFPILKWNTDIKIELIGNYSKNDSIAIVRIANKLDSITETISIKLSSDDKPNFKIIFLKDGDKIKENYKRVTSSSPTNTTTYIRSTKLFIHNTDNTNNNYLHTLESRIAQQLIQGSFEFYHIRDLKPAKRKSIFNPIFGKGKSTKTLDEKDIAILKEIYKPNFEKKLELAKKEFSYVIENMENAKSLRRDKSLWWVKNPIAIIILPALLFILFSIYLLKKINNFLVYKIKNSRARFLILLFGIVFLTAVLIILSISAFDFLTIPDDYSKVPLIRKDTILTTVVFSLFSMPILLLMRAIELRIQKKVNSIVQKTALIFISTGFLPFMLMFLLFFLTSFVENNKQEVYATLANIFVFLMILATLRTLVSYFYFKESKLIIDNELKLSALRELKTKAELKSLQSQINPHFLYNSLNSIASLAPIDAEKTQKMAHSLSDLFKYSINRKGQKMSTVKDEIEMVQAYLEIEKIRFGERLQFTIQVDETLLNYEIPLFIMQPLVENAVKHGISKNREKGEIQLKITTKATTLLIEVTDNGPNFPEGLVSGHGLQTVYDLLRLSYGENAFVNWTNAPEKTMTITIPKNTSNA